MIAAFSPALRIRLLIFHSIDAPVLEFSAAMPRPGFVEPFVEVKEPAMTTLSAAGLTSMALMPYPPRTEAVKGRRAPVVALTAAMREREPPAMLEKLPTSHTVLPAAAMSETCALAPGFHGSSAPVAVLKAAILLRFDPAMVVNEPAT